VVTKTLKDAYGWLLKCKNANEFEESRKIFCQSTSVLNRLSFAKAKSC
jgi:hypothetical protein